MKIQSFKKLIIILIVICMVCVLGACSRIRSIELPPLPTPSAETPAATADPFQPTQPAPVQPEMQTPVPVPTVFSIPSPAPTPVPTPEPTPVPTPTPYVEDPNIPHLFIEGETLPQSMGQYGVAELYGNIYTDKGVIAMVWGRIVDADGVVVQNCKYYPYTDSFSLAGTVNAELHFAVLEPGHYAYVVSAIAENNSYSSGEKVLIEHPFEIYYP